MFFFSELTEIEEQTVWMQTKKHLRLLRSWWDRPRFWSYCLDLQHIPDTQHPPNLCLLFPFRFGQCSNLWLEILCFCRYRLICLDHIWFWQRWQQQFHIHTDARTQSYLTVDSVNAPPSTTVRTKIDSV